MSGPAPAAFAAVVARKLRQLEARIADLAGRPALPGKPGRPGKDAPAPTAAQIRAALQNWLGEHATVLRGEPGRPGRPGKDAPAPSLAQLRRAVQAWMRDNAGLLRGEPGKRGANGWTPRLRLVNKGARSLIELHGWMQTEGEPPTGWLGVTGIVEHDREATDIRGAPGLAYAGAGGLSREEVLAIIEESAMQQYDDYAEVEYLEDQLAGAEPLIFAFSAPVQFIVVEMVSTLDQAADADAIEAAEGRVTTGDQIPTANLGAILKHEVPVTLLTTTDTVRVLPAADTRVTVYGKRRPAA